MKILRIPVVSTNFFGMREATYEGSMVFSTGVYACRTVGCYRDHWNFDRPIVARGPGCAGGLRRSQCTNNLKQIMLAAQMYHDSYKTLPARECGTCGYIPATQSGGTSNGDYQHNNMATLSGFVAMLPYMEQKPLYDQISTGWPGPGGPAPWESYAGWNHQPPTLLCPSDGAAQNVNNKNIYAGWGSTDYNFCAGDSVLNLSGALSQLPVGVDHGSYV